MPGQAANLSSKEIDPLIATALRRWVVGMADRSDGHKRHCQQKSRVLTFWKSRSLNV